MSNIVTTNIDPLIERFNSQHFYGESVGIYLVNLQDKILLFDIPTYSKEIEDYLLSKKKPMIALLSHGSCGISDGAVWQKKVGLKVYLHEADKDHDWLKMQPDVLFSTPPELNSNIEIIHTPGHSPGSVCLLDKKSNTLFTGDTVGGKEGKIRDFRGEAHQYDDIPERIKSCEKFLDYDFDKILPFHYEMILENGKKELEGYIKHIS